MARQAVNTFNSASAQASLEPGLTQHYRLAFSNGKRGYVLVAMVALLLLAVTMTAGVATGKFSWIALLFPVVLAISFALGVTSPRLALAFLIVSVLSE